MSILYQKWWSRHYYPCLVLYPYPHIRLKVGFDKRIRSHDTKITSTVKEKIREAIQYLEEIERRLSKKGIQLETASITILESKKKPIVDGILLSEDENTFYIIRENKEIPILYKQRHIEENNIPLLETTEMTRTKNLDPLEPEKIEELIEEINKPPSLLNRKTTRLRILWQDPIPISEVISRVKVKAPYRITYETPVAYNWLQVKSDLFKTTIRFDKLNIELNIPSHIEPRIIRETVEKISFLEEIEAPLNIQRNRYQITVESDLITLIEKGRVVQTIKTTLSETVKHVYTLILELWKEENLLDKILRTKKTTRKNHGYLEYLKTIK